MKLLRVDQLPKERRAEATDRVAAVASDPNAYMRFHGKRLNGRRDTIAVPLGQRFRLLFLERDGRHLFCGAATHETYNRIASNNSTERLSPMKPVLKLHVPPPPPTADINAKPEASAPLPAPPPPPPPPTRVAIVATLKDWIASAKPGEVITTNDLFVLSGGSYNGANHALVRAVARGSLVKTGIGRYEVPPPRTIRIDAEPLDVTHVDFTAPDCGAGPADALMAGFERAAASDDGQLEQAFSTIRDLLAKRPPLDISTVSDDDLMLEVHRRMVAKRGAA